MQYVTQVARGLFSSLSGDAPVEPQSADDVGEVKPAAEDSMYEVKWTGRVSLYHKQDSVYVQMVPECTMTLAQVEKAPAQFVIDMHSIEDEKLIIRTPVGDMLSLTYHDSTFSVLFVVALEASARFVHYSAIVAGESDKAQDLALRNFVAAYNTASFDTYVNDVDEDGRAGSPDETDLWSPAASPEPEYGYGDPVLPPSGDTEDELMECDVYEDDSGSPLDETPMRRKLQRKTKDTNLMFSDALEDHRLFVLKNRPDHGNVVGVCAYGDEGFDSNNTVDIEGLTWNKKHLHASELVCMPQEHGKALLLDPEAAEGGVYLADLNAEKVVAHYKAADNFDIQIDHVLPTSAETDPSLVTCLVDNNVFAMDLRKNADNCGVTGPTGITKSVLDWSLTLNSSAKYLSCHATSPTGKLAVGNYSGEIRLYSGTPGTQKSNGKANPKTAKTLLKGDGHPIRFLDITQKGDWLLATLDKFLLLLRIDFEDDAGNAKNGFDVPMGERKPKPIKLALSLDKMGAIGAGATFKKARFERTRRDADESRIVASIGNTLASWSLDLIKRNTEIGVRMVGTKTERRNLVDVAAAKDGVKYITESNVVMEKPTVSRTPLRGGKFSLRYKN
ncbi:VID27-like protein [Diplonema papillatum]|nr:VID27-like protein [Diplonema papillatum]